MNTDAQKTFESYKARELKLLSPMLLRLGFSIDEEQAHIGGERYLMVGAQDVGGGGYKLVLLGHRNSDGLRVVIKCSSESQGKKEILQERASRNALNTIPFAYEVLMAPTEILFVEEDDMIIFITEYIVEERPLCTRTLEEQFSLVMKAFRMQEGIHATAHSHTQFIEHVFGRRTVGDECDALHAFTQKAITEDPENSELREVLLRANAFFLEQRENIERYGDFLTHADFVPHNLRVRGDDIYLLDFASVHFGNKYESWARFINYMVLYNRELAEALSAYVRLNRGDAEFLTLRAMRIYKLAFLLQFYTSTLTKTTGDLHALSRLRIHFWTAVMHAILSDSDIPEAQIESYKCERDRLRSDEEIRRQKELRQL